MTETPWEVFKYEFGMFTATFELSPSRTSFPYPIPNAIIESLLLHLRNLCDILLSRDSEADTVSLKKLLPGFKSTKVDELKNLYGTGKTEGSPCWQINKRLAHSTLVRSEGYDHGPALEQLVPVIFSLVDEIQRARAK